MVYLTGICMTNESTCVATAQTAISLADLPDSGYDAIAARKPDANLATISDHLSVAAFRRQRCR
jgi:hypothetical protein